MHSNKETESRYKQLAAALKGDGCSSSPDLFYRPCCDEHDVYYRTGKDKDGNPISRAEADKRFRKCMQKHGKTPIFGRWLVPWVYWAVVRGFASKAYKGKRDNEIV